MDKHDRANVIALKKLIDDAKANYEMEANKLGIDEHVSTLERITEEVEGLRDQETEKFDNMPSSLQESEKGQAINNAAQALDSAYDKLEEIVQNLNELGDKLSQVLADLDSASESLDEAIES
jgi:ABC-type transporter Mla subunit MlaD